MSSLDKFRVSYTPPDEEPPDSARKRLFRLGRRLVDGIASRVYLRIRKRLSHVSQAGKDG